jgi:hypothetical protein
MKKAYIVAVSIIAGIILLVLLSLRLKPGETITLPAADFVSSEGYVIAHGSWVADTNFGVISEAPINTAEIKCYQSTGYCSESRSYKNDATGDMITQSFEYKITSWTAQEVSALSDGLAGTIAIKIDIPKKLVAMVETEKQGINGARRLPAYAHLDDGNKALEASKK